MKVVEQKEKFGCVVACIAMVLGRSYDDIRKDWYNDFGESGVQMDKAVDYLGENGCTVISKELINWTHRNLVRKEMLRPFAPSHIVRIQQFSDADFGHVFVMDKNGKAFCPQKTDQDELFKCYAVTHVLGVFR